jgi:PIN domain nuclease of toxin-antitoxin system
MRFLLDTHLVLWLPISDRHLSRAARAVVTDRANEFFFSAASLWEIALKRALYRRSFAFDPGEIRRQMIENGYEELPVLGAHVIRIDSLAPIHNDPFDRLLIAQAMVEGITLLTANATIARSPGPIRKV